MAAPQWLTAGLCGVLTLWLLEEGWCLTPWWSRSMEAEALWQTWQCQVGGNVVCTVLRMCVVHKWFQTFQETTGG